MEDEKFKEMDKEVSIIVKENLQKALRMVISKLRFKEFRKDEVNDYIYNIVEEMRGIKKVELSDVDKFYINLLNRKIDGYKCDIKRLYRGEIVLQNRETELD